MKNTLLILLAILFPLAVFAEDKNSAPTKVGLILPMSGVLAEYGTAVYNGIELAKASSPEISKNCDFVLEDSKYDSKTAVSSFQKLTSINKINIIYNWGGPTSEAISPLADHNNVALFVWSADPRVAEGKKQVIRFCNSGADYGSVIVEYLKKQGFRNIGIVKTDNQYIESILDGVKKFAAELPVKVIDNYQPSDQDFRTTIAKIKGEKFDALGLFLLSGQVSQFVNQLRDQKVSLPIFGTDFFESMTEVKQSQGGLIGAVFANNEVSPQFRDTYVNKYKNDLQINHAANGYDFAKFLCEKLGSQLSKISPLQTIEMATKLSPFKGEQGEAEFSTSNLGDKYFHFPVVVRKIQSDKIVTENAG